MDLLPAGLDTAALFKPIGKDIVKSDSPNSVIPIINSGKLWAIVLETDHWSINMPTARRLKQSQLTLMTSIYIYKEMKKHQDSRPWRHWWAWIQTHTHAHRKRMSEGWAPSLQPSPFIVYARYLIGCIIFVGTAIYCNWKWHSTDYI